MPLWWLNLVMDTCYSNGILQCDMTGNAPWTTSIFSLSVIYAFMLLQKVILIHSENFALRKKSWDADKLRCPVLFLNAWMELRWRLDYHIEDKQRRSGVAVSSLRRYGKMNISRPPLLNCASFSYSYHGWWLHSNLQISICLASKSMCPMTMC